MPAHIHADLMKQYAEDAMTTDKPWEFWQCLTGGSAPVWFDLHKCPEWLETVKYRRKPRTISINGHEVPEPMWVEPAPAETFWFPRLAGTDIAEADVWANAEFERTLLARGLCHSTREAAEAHARALLSFTEVKA